MEAWIVYNKEDAERNVHYIECYMKEGKKLGIIFHLIYVEDVSFGIKNGTLCCWREDDILKKPDFVISRTIYPLFTKQLEYMEIPVFNSYKVANICNDKASTYQLISKFGIQTIDSEFCKNNYFYERLSHTKEPTVVKAVSGHGGSQVFLVNPNSTQYELDMIYNAMEGEDIVIQPYIKGNNQDVRVYVIGRQIIAAVLRTANEGFKSNYSLGGSVSLYHLSQAQMDIVNKIISNFEFGLVGIDFILNEKGDFIFNEIEDVVGARMLYQCSNINIVVLYLQYIKTLLNN